MDNAGKTAKIDFNDIVELKKSLTPPLTPPHQGGGQDHNSIQELDIVCLS
ncbi:MAG: hypothetical protein Q8S84_06515 [bacterium]|nr:hypothetical protein [bacterium]MDP3381119.1 hypothetical protein [bacterium]